MFESGLLTSSPSQTPFLAGHADRNRVQCRTRPNSSTSFIRFQSPASLLNQPNVIGCIGGVSVISTLIFLDKLVSWSSREGKRSLPFVACSDPALSEELHSQREARTQLNGGRVVENLRRKRKFLEQSGAQCLVMPCHVSHAWYREVCEDCSLPFLHLAECVALELKKAKLKPIHAATAVRIGVLTTNPALVASYYKEKLQYQGFEVLLLDTATNEHTLVPAMEALKRKDMEGARNLLRIAIQVLLVKAVRVVVLASDELLDLLPPTDPLLKKCIDPMDALARSTIHWAESIEKVPQMF